MSDTQPRETMSRQRDHQSELLAHWEAAWDEGRGEDLSPRQLAPQGPPALWDALAEDIAFLKGFGRKFNPDPKPRTEDEAASFQADGYQGLHEINEGGQGKVILARDVKLDREVAVKRLKRHWLWNDSAQRRLAREAHITGRLEHPSVIPIYGFGRDAKGSPYYAMRYLREERTLEDVIAGVRGIADPADRLSASRKLLRDFVTICQTIDYAHSRGVIHRDLKPSNIMIGDYGEIFVVDWGLAKLLGEKDDGRQEQDPPSAASANLAKSLTVGVAGTLGYMSPEQATETRTVGKPSDVFSLGATLYHLLTGEPPFNGESASEILAKIKAGKFAAPRSVDPNTPAALEAICIKAMATEEADRYASAGAIADDLARWLDDRPVNVWPDPWVTTARRWMKRHRLLVASGGAALVVAMVSLLIATVFLEAARQRERKANLDLAAANGLLESQNTELRRPRYATQFQLASALYDELDVAEAERILDSTDADLRGLEWTQLKRACRTPATLPIRSPFQLEAGASISGSAMSPDGRYFAAAFRTFSLNNPFQWNVRVVELPSGKLRYSKRGEGVVAAIEFSPDGRRLAAAVEPPPEDFQPGRLGEGFSRRDPISPARPTLERGTAPTLQPPADAKPAISPRAEFLVWEMKTGEPQENIDGEAYQRDFTGAAAYEVTRMTAGEEVQFRYDGQPVHAMLKISFTLAAEKPAEDPAKLTLKEMLARTRTILIPAMSPLQTAALSPDRTILATAHEDGGIRLWTVPQGRQIDMIAAPSNRISQLRFTPDGQRVVYAGEQGVWVSQLPPGPDRLAVDADWPTTQQVQQIRKSADGGTAATLDAQDMLRVWETATGKPRLEMQFAHLVAEPWIRDFALSSDGALLAIAEADMKTRIVRVSAGAEVTISNLTGPLVFKPGASQLIACRGDGRTLVVVDAHSGEVLKQIETSEISSPAGPRGSLPRRLACTPAGDRLVVLPASGSSESLQIWNLTTGQPEKVPEKVVERELGGRYGGVRRLWFSPDGALAVVVFNEGELAQVWETEKWRVAAVLNGHRGAITDVAFSRDGSRIATACQLGTVRLWDAKTGAHLWTFSDNSGPPEPFWFVTFADDDRELIAGSAKGVVAWRSASQAP
ncbi:MAG: WD40 repeat domain-containing serine/threonine-protein kinase [Pirellulaceae bacterium]